MKLPWGFELSSETLKDFPIIAYTLLAIITLSLVKMAFGKEIVWLVKKAKEYFSTRDKTKKHDDWIAVCEERHGWIQKGDAEALDLEGKYLKKLSFSISPIGKPANWRGGFILGNEKFHPQHIVDSDKAITIHAGSPPPIAKAQHVWIYDWNHVRNHPDSTTVKLLSKAKIDFDIVINENNFLSVQVNNQQVYSNRIDASYRRKVYLLGWGDYADCRVKFENIKVTI